MKNIATRLLLIFVSILFTYLMLEIGYRVLRYSQLAGGDEPFAFWWVDKPLFQLDEAVGYQYIPDQQVRLTLTDQFDQGVHANNMRVNNIGNNAFEDDRIQKGEGVFRIALIGDSFTAGNFNDTPWAETLEDILNENLEGDPQPGIDQVQVMNFGMEAIGVGQFDEVYDLRVEAYEPDLVIVNFVSYDLTRKFLWRDTVTVTVNGNPRTLVLSCVSLPVDITNPDCALGNLLVLPHEMLSDSDALAQLRRDIYQLDLERRPWFGIYPELLAAVAGESLGLTPHLERAGNAVLEYADIEEALRVSEAALREIETQHPNVIILHNPMFYEMEGGLNPLATRFMDAYPDLNIISMIETLPLPENVGDVQHWFNLPFDNHFSDAGAAVYAGAVAEIITERQ